MKTKKILSSICLIALFSTSMLITGCDGSSKVEDPEEQSTFNDLINFNFSEKVPEEGLAERAKILGQDIAQIQTGSKFGILVNPLDEGLFLLSQLGDYYAKKYTDSEIRNEFKPYLNQYEHTDKFLVILFHIGGVDNETDMTIEENFYEFFFLENEDGEYVRASQQELDSPLNLLNMVNSQIYMTIGFNKNEVADLMQNHDHLYMTFDGLNINDEDRVEIQYPYSKSYESEFPELQTMLKDMGL